MSHDVNMSASTKPIIPLHSPPNLFNLRQVIPTCDENDNEIGTTTLYRCSRPDLLSPDESEWFRKNGIKAVFDCRSANEYINHANGMKYIDRDYTIRKVRFPFMRWRYHIGEDVETVPKKSRAHQVQAESPGTHFMIDFFRINYIVTVFTRAPWYFMLYSLLYLAADLVKWTGYFSNFVGVYAKRILNPMNLIGQYRDIIDHSQLSIVSVLKLLTNPDHIPAVINCAHGKDRTGILVAIILSLLGKSKKFIAWDYALSEEGLSRIRDRVRKEVIDRYQMSEEFIIAKAETMMELLNYIDERYGGVESYLEQVGLGREEQELLKRNITGKHKQN